MLLYNEIKIFYLKKNIYVIAHINNAIFGRGNYYKIINLKLKHSLNLNLNRSGKIRMIKRAERERDLKSGWRER